MSDSLLAGLVVFAVIMGLIVAIVKIIREPKSSGITSLTAFHDLQPKDKQAGIESVIEQGSEKKMEEQDRGKGKP